MGIFIAIQTLIVYLITTFVLYSCASYTRQTGNFKYINSGIIFYSIIFGLRYGVGYDCNSYIEGYEELLNAGSESSYESGFNGLMNVLVFFQAGSFFFLATTSYIQLYLVFFAFRRFKGLSPYIVLTFMLGCVWLTFSNGIRQEIAFSIYLFALSIASKGKFLKFYLLIFIASLFHTSALILLIIYPLYYFFSENWIPSKYLQSILILIAIVVGQLPIVQNSLDVITNAAVLFGYDIYAESEFSNLLIRNNNSIGIGFIIQLLLSLVIIINSKYISNDHKLFRFMYFLYFGGLLYKYLFSASLLLQRINYYFYGLEFIIGAVVLCNCIRSKNKKTYYQLMSLYIMYFIATLYRMFENYSAFFFVWQSDLFHTLHK